MPLFFVQSEAPDRAKVLSIHYKPELLPPETVTRGILVETKLEPEYQPRKIGVLYINPQTLTQWYEYIDRPLTLDELLSDMMAQFKRIEQMVIHSYRAWATGVSYSVGDVIQYGGLLYEVIQAHTSQAGWTPPAVPALFRAKTVDGTIAAWVQPTGAHDAYTIHSQVIHNGQIWISLIDANVWEPGVYGWSVLW